MLIIPKNKKIISILDDSVDVLSIKEGANQYFAIGTANGTEFVTFGNNTTNPTYNFFGTGTATFSGDVDVDGNITAHDMTLDFDGVRGWDFKTDSGTHPLAIQQRRSGQATRIRVYTHDGDGTDSMSFTMFSLGLPASRANSESVELAFNIGASAYDLKTAASGSGTVMPLRLYTGANTTQLVLNTDGSVSLQGLIIKTTRVTSSPYAVLATDDEIFVDTDGGAITVNLPAGIDGKRYRIINTGSSDNDVTVAPNGAELLTGENASRTLSDSSVIILTYETTEGWW